MYIRQQKEREVQYSYMQNVQFHATSHTREQAINPPPSAPTFLFPGGISLIVELTSKINQCPLPFKWYLCPYFNES